MKRPTYFFSSKAQGSTQQVSSKYTEAGGNVQVSQEWYSRMTEVGKKEVDKRIGKASKPNSV